MRHSLYDGPRPRWTANPTREELAQRLSTFPDYLEACGVDDCAADLRACLRLGCDPAEVDRIRIRVHKHYALDEVAEEMIAAMDGDDLDAERNAFGTPFDGEEPW